MVYFCETCMQALQGTVRLRLEEMAGRRKPLPAKFQRCQFYPTHNLIRAEVFE